MVDLDFFVSLSERADQLRGGLDRHLTTNLDIAGRGRSRRIDGGPATEDTQRVDPRPAVSLLDLDLDELAWRRHQLRVPEATVRRWIREGKLRATMLGGTKTGYRIPESEVDRLLRGTS